MWLEQTEIHDLSALPAHLTALKLSGPSFDNLDGLPQALTSLALWGTKVKSLRKLPRSIQNLELVANTDLRIAAEDLPPLLTRLTIDEQSTPDLTGLKYLDWLSDRSSKPSGKWPLSLSSLTVRASNLEELPPFPPSLRALGLLHTALSPFAKLPPEIEDLSLIDYRGPQIEGLPRGLKRLNLSFSSNLKTVPELPRDLEELDLTGTTVTDLRGLPPTIRRLVFRGFPLRELRGLADQLPNLETLDVSESPRLEVIDALPTRLLTLNVSRTGITSLPQLPPCLHALALSEVVSLEHLPKELRALRFVSRAAP